MRVLLRLRAAMADRDAEEDSTSVDFGEFGKERPLPLEYLRDWCRKFKHKSAAQGAHGMVGWLEPNQPANRDHL